MESDLQQHHYHLHHRRQANSGLTRYQSAPSSYFSSFSDKDTVEEFLNRPTSPETERIFSRFLQSSDSKIDNVDRFLDHSFVRESHNDLDEKTEIKVEEQTEFLEPMDVATEAINRRQQQQQQQLQEADYSSGSVSQNSPQSQTEQQQSRLKRKSGLHRLPLSTKIEGGGGGDGCGGSNLVRHSSSPAGLFASIDVESAYVAVMRSMGDCRGGDGGSIKREASFTTTSRPPPSAGKMMSSVFEIANKPGYSSGLPPRSSCEDSSSNAKRLAVGDRTLSGGLNLSKTKNVDTANRRPPLAHHLSLPKSLSDIEKLLELSDTVKIRAKRGCATHPRSIAERVRRTRISEKLKKLQDLVPNMDKQTNTADMLDLAVEYIKDLQKQLKALAEYRARCTCSSMHQRQ